MESILQRWVPAFDWLRKYKSKNLRGDAIAGITTAVMLIPQAMAYALLAGLPPVIGLYASIVPLLVYAMFGTSRQLAVGPVAMVALLVASGIGSMVTPGDIGTYVELTILLTLLVGVIQLAMGVFRLGFMTNFLSHPVISGFTSAAALIIGFSQLKHIVGINLPRSENILKTIYLTFQQASDINPVTLIMGLITIVFLIFARKISPLLPGALIIVIISSLITWFWDLKKLGVSIVGEIPAGLPPFSVPSIQLEELGALLPIALTISFVGFMESIAVGKQIATEKQYEIDAN
ncbi:MAG: SulP family inorganic anion transporter, partial [Proteobacteria bacterium]|nr:SulP family inorganic anion transporter [Pseudomonadota bacterium]